MKLELVLLEQEFSICKLEEGSGVDWSGEFLFLAKTDEELSLVCPTCQVPAAATHREGGWRAFKIDGVLDFGLVGILAGITGVLAAARIGLFAISTYNTDYIWVRAENVAEAAALLAGSGYAVKR